MKIINFIRQFVIFLILFFLLCFIFPLSIKANGASIIRPTWFGKVAGAKTQNVLQWKGVPYGGNVSGKNRWQKPINPMPWRNVRKTTSSGTAIQYNGSTVSGKENQALTLDIYRPDNNQTNLPVMFYVHGGNDQTGSSTEIKGTAFAKAHNAIVVSVNYRLGALGFNPLPALKGRGSLNSSGNYGLLDLHQALSWVQSNIGFFGGNGHNITVSGFSAGGRDVMAMLISPLFKGQFQRAIVFSGGMTTSKVKPSQEVFEQTFAKTLAPLVVKDKIKPNEIEAQKWLMTKDPKVKQFLDSVNASTLAKTFGGAGIRMEGFPHLYRDGFVLPKNGFETRNYNQVPVILFSGTHEFSSFASWDDHFSSWFDDDSIYTDPFKTKQFNFVKRYGGKFYSSFNIEDSANKMLQKGYRAPIYGMQMSFGDNSKVVGNQKMGLLGAFHGVWTPLFDVDQASTTNPPAYTRPGAKKLAIVFQDYLYNFMTGKRLQVSRQPQIWNDYNQNGKTLRISASLSKVYSHMEKKNYSYQDVLNEIKTDHTLPRNTKSFLIKNILNGRWFSKKLDQTYHNESLFEKEN